MTLENSLKNDGIGLQTLTLLKHDKLDVFICDDRIDYGLMVFLSRTRSPTEFIPEFLKQNGYEIQKIKSQEFFHDKEESYLAASAKKDGVSHRVSVHLDIFNRRANVRYEGKGLTELPVINDLVCEMIRQYNK